METRLPSYPSDVLLIHISAHAVFYKWTSIIKSHKDTDSGNFQAYIFVCLFIRSSFGFVFEIGFHLAQASLEVLYYTSKDDLEFLIISLQLSVV